MAETFVNTVMNKPFCAMKGENSVLVYQLFDYKERPCYMELGSCKY